MKRIIYTLVGMMLSVGAWAQNVAKIGTTEYATLADAIAAVTEDQTITITNDCSISSEILISKTVNLDLNGKTVTTNSCSAFQVNGGKLNLTGSEGSKIVGAPTNYKLIYLYGSTDAAASDYSVVNVGANVTVDCTNGYAVMLSANGKSGYGVKVNVDGTATGDYGGLYVNGNITNTDGNVPVFTIGQDARIISTSGTALYAAGYAEWNIAGNIEGKDTGIEIRAGKLNVTDGNIIGNGEVTNANANGNGTTSVGAGIAVAQHTTKLPIDVKISGGTIKGYTAFYQIDAQANGEEALNKITLDITGGTFETIHGGTNAIYSENKSGFVSGGTFSSAVLEEYCANNFIPTKNDDGTYGVKEGSYIAQINGVKYETLADAIAAVPDGVETTITLLANTTENVTIPAGKNIILDLNGKTLSGGSVATNGKKAAIVNNGTLIIQDSSTEQTGTIKREDNDTGLSASNSYYVMDNQGTMTIKSGNVINNAGLTTTHKGSSLIRVGEKTTGAVLNIEGGTLTQNNFDVIKIGGDATLNISGGTINSSKSYAVLAYGNMNMTAGTINGNVCLRSYADATEDSHGVGNITGGTINGNITVETYTGNTPNTLSECKISGTAVINGTLSVGEGNGNSFAANDEKGTIAVSGGTFSKAVPEKYCADGFIPKDNGDGTYGVEEGEYVAQVGEMQYTSLAVAVAEAEEGATVTLLTNVTLAQRIEPGKNMTIDLNGKKVITTATCGNGSAFDVKGGEVIIKNGTIDGTQVTEIECDAITARSGANVTLQDLNITVDSKNGACAYAFDGAKITIESGYYENITTETYQHNANITAMVVNQANVTTQLVEIKGGTFKGYDPAMGDDSQLSNENHTFLAPGFYTEKNADGTYGLMDEYTVNDGIAFKSLVKPAIVKTATYSRTMPMETTWGTVCLPFSLKQGDGNTTPKLYTFGSISAETLTVTEVENEVAPGIAVIFSYSGSDKAVFATTDAKVNTTVVPSSETLIGTFEDQTITDGLGNIYFINGDKFHQAKVSLTVPAYRAYINYAGSTNAKPSVLNINIADSDNDIDGIAGVTLDELNSTEAIYDANGCKLSAPQKGLNIMKLASGKTVKLIIK